MGITVTTIKDDPEAREVSNFNGHEKGRVSHSFNCPHHSNKTVDLSGILSPECEGKFCHVNDSLYLKEIYVGKVLSVGEHNWYDDSDFYAYVWDESEGRAREYEYGSTRYGYYGSAKVDATPEVIAKYEAWKAEENAKFQAEKAAKEAKTPGKGKIVKVVKGRKVLKGLQGVCIWTGRDKFTSTQIRVGFKVDDQVYFTAASNVVVVC
jgi:hypothetical protein